MQVTDPNVIRAGERDLIESVKDDLDWDVVRGIVKSRLDRAVLEAKGGEIVVHDNRIAFRMDLSLNLDVSLMFDRDGNYIRTAADDDLETENGDMVSDASGSLNDESGFPAAESLDDDLIDPEMDASSVDLSDLDLADSSGDDSGYETIDPEMESVADDSLVLDLEQVVDEGSQLNLDEYEDDSLEIDMDSSGDDESGELDLEELSLPDGSSDESLDDDIDDILKESREFWEQKKTD